MDPPSALAGLAVRHESDERVVRQRRARYGSATMATTSAPIGRPREVGVGCAVRPVTRGLGSSVPGVDGRDDQRASLMHSHLAQTYAESRSQYCISPSRAHERLSGFSLEVSTDKPESVAHAANRAVKNPTEVSV